MSTQASDDAQPKMEQDTDSGKIQQYYAICKGKRAKFNITQGIERTSPPPHVWFFPNVDFYPSIFIAGAPGCGKSTQVRNLALIYQELHPDNMIYLITTKSRDDADTIYASGSEAPGIVGGKVDMDVLQITRSADVKKYKARISDARFVNALVIFDDNVTADDRLQHEIDNLENSVLLLKRSSGITAVITKHTIMDSRNRILKNNCQLFCIFPKNSSRMHCEAFLTTHGIRQRDQKTIIETLGSHDPLWITLVSPTLYITPCEVGDTNDPSRVANQRSLSTFNSNARDVAMHKGVDSFFDQVHNRKRGNAREETYKINDDSVDYGGEDLISDDDDDGFFSDNDDPLPITSPPLTQRLKSRKRQRTYEPSLKQAPRARSSAWQYASQPREHATYVEDEEDDRW